MRGRARRESRALVWAIQRVRRVGGHPDAASAQSSLASCGLGGSHRGRERWDWVCRGQQSLAATGDRGGHIVVDCVGLDDVRCSGPRQSQCPPANPGFSLACGVASGPGRSGGTADQRSLRNNRVFHRWDRFGCHLHGGQHLDELHLRRHCAPAIPGSGPRRGRRIAAAGLHTEVRSLLGPRLREHRARPLLRPRRWSSSRLPAPQLGDRPVEMSGGQVAAFDAGLGCAECSRSDSSGHGLVGTSHPDGLVSRTTLREPVLLEGMRRPDRAFRAAPSRLARDAGPRHPAA